MFVEELKYCIEYGLIVKNKQIRIGVDCFICDSPARAFIKNTVNFNAFHGCLKCETNGVWSHTANTMVFPDLNARPRTDEAFRNQSDPGHHRGITPLIEVPSMDLIRDIVIGDELHLLHLGLMKKFMNGWRTGSFGLRTKWSKINEKEIDSYLLSCQKPIEIHRKIRGLIEMARWKGTEFRTFLLYLSIVVLKKFLPEKFYNHYLLFYCAVVIFGSQYHCSHMIDIADDMIKIFLNLFKTMYGIQFFTSNMHNLSHLADEVRRFGVLGNFNAYCFENKLQSIKKMVRSGNMQLRQICKRISEEDTALINEYSSGSEFSEKIILSGRLKFTCNQFDAIGQSYGVFKRLKTQDLQVECSLGDKWILTQDRDIISVQCFVQFADGKCFMYGTAITEKEPFFTTPISSDILCIYAAKNEFKAAKMYPAEKVACKMFKLGYFGTFDETEIEEETPKFDSVFIPIWHTLK